MVVRLAPFTWDAALSGEERGARLVQRIDAWVRSPAMGALLRSDRLEPPGQLSTSELTGWILDATDSWDLRRGRERNSISPSQAWTPERADIVMAASAALGLTDPPPPSGHGYDVVLVLGARLGALLARVAYARELATAYARPDPIPIVALTGHRPLDQVEQDTAARLEIDGLDEFAAMVHILTADRVASSAEEDRAGRGHTSFDGGTIASVGAQVTVIAAPSSVPGRRADTADTMRWWARQRELTLQRALVVTSSIYVTYQGLVAAHVLGMVHGMTVETVGVPAAVANLFPDTAVLTPAHYLQEIRATVQAAKNVLDALDGEPTR